MDVENVYHLNGVNNVKQDMLILMVTALIFVKMMNIGTLLLNNAKIAMCLIVFIVEDRNNALNVNKDTHYFLILKDHSALNVQNHANIALLILTKQEVLKLNVKFVRTIIS